MASCPKCGNALLPDSEVCGRCGSTAGKPGPMVLVGVSAAVMLLAGIGGAAFFLMRSEPAPAPAVLAAPPVAPVSPPVADAPSEEQPAAIATATDDAQRQVAAALAQAREQLAEAKKQVKDEKVRRQLDEAMKQVGGAPPAEQGGGCDAAAIQRVMKQHLREVRACHERQLKARPGLKGTLRAQLVIEPSGAVRSVEITQDTAGDAGLAGCVQAAVKRWVFPASGEPCTVALPFVFRAD